jgi:hypothetical protein
MDICCPRCGEPWSVFSRGEDMTISEWNAMMARQGCPCCRNKQITKTPARAQVMRVLQDVLGDDIDGIAAELEDAEGVIRDMEERD